MVRQFHYSKIILIIFYCYILTGFSARMKTLERSSRSLKSEKSHLQDDIAKLKESLAAKDKDLKAARNAYHESQDEITTVTDK